MALSTYIYILTIYINMDIIFFSLLSSYDLREDRDLCVVFIFLLSSLSNLFTSIVVDCMHGSQPTTEVNHNDDEAQINPRYGRECPAHHRA